MCFWGSDKKSNSLVCAWYVECGIVHHSSLCKSWAVDHFSIKFADVCGPIVMRQVENMFMKFWQATEYILALAYLKFTVCHHHWVVTKDGTCCSSTD